MSDLTKARQLAEPFRQLFEAHLRVQENVIRLGHKHGRIDDITFQVHMKMIEASRANLNEAVQLAGLSKLEPKKNV